MKLLKLLLIPLILFVSSCNKNKNETTSEDSSSSSDGKGVHTLTSLVSYMFSFLEYEDIESKKASAYLTYLYDALTISNYKSYGIDSLLPGDTIEFDYYGDEELIFVEIYPPIVYGIDRILDIRFIKEAQIVHFEVYDKDEEFVYLSSNKYLSLDDNYDRQIKIWSKNTIFIDETLRYTLFEDLSIGDDVYATYSLYDDRNPVRHAFFINQPR